MKWISKSGKMAAEISEYYQKDGKVGLYIRKTLEVFEHYVCKDERRKLLKSYVKKTSLLVLLIVGFLTISTLLTSTFFIHPLIAIIVIIASITFYIMASMPDKKNDN